MGQREKNSKVDRQEDHQVAFEGCLAHQKYQEAPLVCCLLRKMAMKDLFSMARRAEILSIPYAILQKSIGNMSS